MSGKTGTKRCGARRKEREQKGRMRGRGLKVCQVDIYSAGVRGVSRQGRREEAEEDGARGRRGARMKGAKVVAGMIMWQMCAGQRPLEHLSADAVACRAADPQVCFPRVTEETDRRDRDIDNKWKFSRQQVEVSERERDREGGREGGIKQLA
eukprot:764171-Hanusia_phi.AAC.12